MEEEWDFLHVRKPDYNREEMINFLEMIPEYHHKVVLHSHYDLIRDFEVAGISLNKRVLSEFAYEDELKVSCDYRQYLIRNGDVYVHGIKPDLVSYSGHRFSEIQHLPINTDYVFLSPIFDSISKRGYTSGFDDAEILGAFLSETNRKVIALGGIDNTRIEKCKNLGFDGYAMLGYIWSKYFTFVETIQ